jgi:Sec-independent protein translocase protein TatA
MNIGIGQIILIILVCFLLFGNVSNVVSNLRAFLDKFKNF